MCSHCLFPVVTSLKQVVITKLVTATDLLQVVPTRLVQAVRNKVLPASYRVEIIHMSKF